MKTKSYLVYALCAMLNSCGLVDAQVIWLSTKNQDFSNCDREERELRSFDGITNTCPFDVIYEQSDEQYVIVEGDKEYFNRLHTDIRRGVLEISVDPARYRNVRLRVRVGSPRINQVFMNGSGSIVCKTDIVAEDNFTLGVSGSGDIVAEKIRCGNMETSVVSSGDIRVSGIEARNVAVTMSGSGDWAASFIKADNLTASIAGSGDIEIANVQIENTLTASVAGSGDIDISGHAGNVNAKVVGSGDISGHLSYERISKNRSGSGDIDW